MLRLPDTPALDARPRVKRVDDAPPEEVRRDRQWGNLVLARGYLAEEKPESWSGGTKLSRGRHREVELKRVRQEKHAVDGRTALEVGKVHRSEFVDERARPVMEHVGERHVVGDAEGEIQVGEPVAPVDGERADGSSGNHALILLRKP